jgi:hypothetical protein
LEYTEEHKAEEWEGVRWIYLTEVVAGSSIANSVSSNSLKIPKMERPFQYLPMTTSSALWESVPAGLETTQEYTPVWEASTSIVKMLDFCPTLEI